MGVVDWVIIAIVAAGILVAVFGWDRYRGNSKSPAGTEALQPTNEVFIDPATGRRTRVWHDPKTGHREYRQE